MPPQGATYILPQPASFSFGDPSRLIFGQKHLPLEMIEFTTVMQYGMGTCPHQPDFNTEVLSMPLTRTKHPLSTKVLLP